MSWASEAQHGKLISAVDKFSNCKKALQRVAHHARSEDQKSRHPFMRFLKKSSPTSKRQTGPISSSSSPALYTWLDKTCQWLEAMEMTMAFSRNCWRCELLTVRIWNSGNGRRITRYQYRLPEIQNQRFLLNNKRNTRDMFDTKEWDSPQMLRFSVIADVRRTSVVVAAFNLHEVRWWRLLCSRRFPGILQVQSTAERGCCPAHEKGSISF